MQPDETLPTPNGALIRLTDVLARELALTETEMVQLLGVRDIGELAALRDQPSSAVPTEVIERLKILLEIFQALNVLLPEEGRPAQWLRAKNKARMFDGTPAINIMLQGLQRMRDVSRYLQAQRFS